MITTKKFKEWLTQNIEEAEAAPASDVADQTDDDLEELEWVEDDLGDDDIDFDDDDVGETEDDDQNNEASSDDPSDATDQVFNQGGYKWETSGGRKFANLHKVIKQIRSKPAESDEVFRASNIKPSETEANKNAKPGSNYGGAEAPFGEGLEEGRTLAHYEKKIKQYQKAARQGLSDEEYEDFDEAKREARRLRGKKKVVKEQLEDGELNAEAVGEEIIQQKKGKVVHSHNKVNVKKMDEVGKKIAKTKEQASERRKAGITKDGDDAYPRWAKEFGYNSESKAFEDGVYEIIVETTEQTKGGYKHQIRKNHAITHINIKGGKPESTEDEVKLALAKVKGPIRLFYAGPRAHRSTKGGLMKTPYRRAEKNRGGNIPTAAAKKDAWGASVYRDTRQRRRPVKEDVLDEKLGPGASAKDYIDDFQASKNSKFAGDSQKKRRERAIAAYMHAKNEGIEPTKELINELVGKGELENLVAHYGKHEKINKLKADASALEHGKDDDKTWDFEHEAGMNSMMKDHGKVLIQLRDAAKKHRNAKEAVKKTDYAGYRG